MRYAFNEVFHENSDGSLTPKRTVRIGQATFGSSITFRKGVSFSGVDVFAFKDLPIDADEEGGVLVIRGVYQ